MATVYEDVMVLGSDEPLRTLERDEQLLLAAPHPSPVPVKLWRDHPALPIVHFPQQYEAQPFAPPRDVYENAQIRIEWQTMDNRQPFYHRNCDVDEISYQIAGPRTLMTELGVVEHRPGEFSRIPRGVAHDNHGRKESHLLFYLPAPVDELIVGERTSETTMPPFSGWQPRPVNEAITECMGTVGHDIAVFGIDEQQLLSQARHEKARLQVLRAPTTPGITWVYGAPTVRLGAAALPAGEDGMHYRRTLDADEIHYQISGRRTVVTQRGIAELVPGDFVRIPLGTAHTSITTERAEFLIVQSGRELPQIAKTSRTADPYSPQHLAAVRTERPIQR
jgi:mannose-6-phosphate isomerase-like protein (cupin superfamily)